MAQRTTTPATMATLNLPNRLYTCEQVAELLQVAPATIREWNRKGYLHGFTLRNRLRFTSKAIDAFLTSQYNQP